MKRSRKADFAASAANAQRSGEPADSVDPKTLTEEEKIERVRRALLEGREESARQRYEEAMIQMERLLRPSTRSDAEVEKLIETIQEAMPPVMRYSGHITRFTETKDGSLVADVSWYSKASDEVVALMEQIQNEEVHLFTGLHWTGLSGQDRLETLERMGQSAELALAASVLEVIPELSRNHVLRWQREINSGGAWVCNEATGEIPKALIEKGYCLHAKLAIDNDHIRSPGRDDLFQGSPGTPSFVAAIMGQAWLVWLQQQE